jgi:NAD/NADP transhydrogenase beta subunit
VPAERLCGSGRVGVRLVLDNNVLIICEALDGGSGLILALVIACSESFVH